MPTGARSVWDYTGATRTFRNYPSREATRADHMIDTTRAGDAETSALTQVSTDDTDGNGIPDERVTMEVDPGRTTLAIMIEHDASESGAWEIAETMDVDAQQPALTTQRSGEAACDDVAALKLQMAYRTALNTGMTCLRSVDPVLARRLEQFVVHDINVSIACDPTEGTERCAHSDLNRVEAFWAFDHKMRLTVHMAVWPDAFGSGCGDLASTLFHELMHFVIGPHRAGNGARDLGDRVYGCEKTCFGHGTSLTCAACTGTRNGADERCMPYPYRACPSAVPALFCNCSGHERWYATEAACAENCTGFGFACFNAQCVGGAGPCP